AQPGVLAGTAGRDRPGILLLGHRSSARSAGRPELGGSAGAGSGLLPAGRGMGREKTRALATGKRAALDRPAPPPGVSPRPPGSTPARTGILFVVSTPIGNLADVTLRALQVLGQSDAVFAEDTRHTRRLLAHHGLSSALVSAHAHNERRREAELVRRLAR